MGSVLILAGLLLLAVGNYCLEQIDACRDSGQDVPLGACPIDQARHDNLED